MTEHRNVSPRTVVSTNFYGSVTGIVDNAYIQAHGGGGVNTNAVLYIVRDEIIPATNMLNQTLSDAIDAHVADKSNPHAVTAAQVGALPLVMDEYGSNSAVTIGNREGTVGSHSLANGMSVTASGIGSHAEGGATIASGDGSYAGGIRSKTQKDDHYSFAWNGDGSVMDPYLSHGHGTFNVNPRGGLDGFWIGERTLYAILTNKADKADISSENPTFSNAVLAVGLNIDTNSVAVLNEIAETFGGFPLGAGETATTVGGLLAALAAAVAWLKKNKIGSFAPVGGASATVDNGVASLSDFFTESNSLLNGRLSYSRNATGLKDRAFNTLSFDGTEYNLSTALAAVTPTANGQPRDLLIVATATAATTISFTAGTIKGDKPTIDGSGTWIITLTEYAANTWYCRQIKMEDAA